MCGRFYIDKDTLVEIQKILSKLNNDFSAVVKTGEVYPTETTMILKADKDNITPAAFKWGFPNYRNKGIIINARSETSFEKKTFRDSLLHRRCVIPASGFYEWDSQKTKIYFSDCSSPILYMAGIYNNFNGEDRYVILTTSANKSMIDIHNRMPLLLKDNELNDWVLDNSATQDILNHMPINLQKKTV